MKIKSFKIQNYKNIKLAECTNAPDFLVICGSNGSGKSSILEALMTAKETVGSYGGFNINPHCVSANSEEATIEITFELTRQEFDYSNEKMPTYLKKLTSLINKIIVTIDKKGNTNYVNSIDGSLNALFRRYAKNESFFDYFSAHRNNSKTSLAQWNPEALTEERVKNALASGTNKFSAIKEYLANLKMSDLQGIQRAIINGRQYSIDSLEDIKNFFNTFFSPMEFDDVYINRTPFEFLINTPMGKVDIDELSSGEKEILNTYIHFQQLNPNNSIIMFDEPDVHLHTELERRYLKVLKSLGEGNQFFITTHSPEMMIEAGEESLFTVLKYQKDPSENQFVKVSNSTELHEALTNVMGASGFVSLNRKIVFIEGESSSTDIAFYQKLFPKEKYNITFVPAGDSTMVKTVSDKVYYLLEQGDGFQKFFCIIDGDIENRHSLSDKLFKLPVYHVENFLLDENLIYNTTKTFFGATISYQNADDILNKLKEIVLTDAHTLPYMRALLDSKVYALSETAKELIFQNKFEELKVLTKIDFATIRPEAEEKLKKAIETDAWKRICKGRDVLKEYCKINQIKYEHFRNALIEQITTPTQELQTIIDKITSN